MNNETLTITDRLDQSIIQLQRLNNLEKRKKNQEQQAKNDIRFQELVHQITQLCQAVHFAQHSFLFMYQPQETLLGVLNDLKTAALRGAVNEESILQCSRKVKPVQDQIKKEWAKHYLTLVGPVTSTLQIIQKIDPISVTKCLQGIQDASIWQNNDSDLLRLKILAEALKNSSLIIERLGLDQEITSFLRKVSDKKATLDDLTDGVLIWIRKEGLTNKIVVSFK